MRIGVIGVGHVGLATAAAVAEIGHDVVAMDLDAAKIELLGGGKTPVHEPGLDDLRQFFPQMHSSPIGSVVCRRVIRPCVGGWARLWPRMFADGLLWTGSERDEHS